MENEPSDYAVDINELDENEKMLTWGNGRYYSAAGFKIKFVRKSRMYILMYYLPSALFVSISWISFFIPPTAYPARFGLLITTILVLVNTFNNVVNNTPMILQPSLFGCLDVFSLYLVPSSVIPSLSLG